MTPDPAGTRTGRAAAWLLLGIAGCAEAQTDARERGWIDWSALDAGEVVVQTDKVSPGVVSVDVAVRIDASPEAIWDVLTACEIAPEYVPNVTDCTVVEQLDGGRAELFRQTVKPMFLIPAFDHVFRLDYTPYRRIDVTGLGGVIRHMSGTWWLEPQAEGDVLLVHHLELDPGLPVPRFLVRTALRRDLPKVVTAVRARAETNR